MKFKTVTRFLVWESMIVLGLLIVIGAGLLAGTGYNARLTGQAIVPVQAEAIPTRPPTPSPSPVPAARPAPDDPGLDGGLAAVTSTGGKTIGWVEAGQTDTPLEPGYLYLLLQNGTVYHGPMQFDPAFIPAGSTVMMAEIPDDETVEHTRFAVNILPNQAGAPHDVVFEAGEQAKIQERLTGSSLQTFNLKNLFPEGWFAPRPNQETSRQLPVGPTATLVMITSTPTPENIITAAAMAQAGPTATTLPPNWVTPWVVTSTPVPENQATATFRQAEATAAAQLYGPPLSPPLNMVTATPTLPPPATPAATPTPVFILLNGDLPPMTPTPTTAIEPIPPLPPQLIGKIAFKSDRSGQEEIYVVNADGSGLALLTGRWPYLVAQLADSFSADGRFRVFTKDTTRYKNVDDPLSDGVIGRREDIPALYWYDSLYKVEEQLTHFGAGIAYDGVWSPTGEQIALVSNDSGNDEIWVINRDGSNRRQITNDVNNWWDKRPSWSPDGRQLVFWSNRTGHRQIWVMDADGANLYSLSRTGFNDWDPVWIKYPNLPGNALAAHMPYIGPYDPAGSDRACGDFESLHEAQTFYLAAGGPYQDPHRLDRDNDGIACN